MNLESLVRLTEMHARFLQFLRGRVGDTATAEDILQTAYVKAMQHGQELRDAESTVAWFYRILRNAMIDHHRRNAAHSKAIDRAIEGWQEGYEPDLKTETCACILEVIRDLKPEYRTAIEEVDLAEKTVESFAKAHGMTANNASVRLHRARRTVAKKLTAVCGSCATDACIDCICKQSAG